MRILAAHIDIALRSPHGQTSNRHAFDQAERVAFHQQAVGKRAGITFVGVAGNVFLRTGCSGHRLPFDAGRKRRATAPAQARVQHLLHDGFRCHGRCGLQTLPAAMGGIVRQAQRINHSHAGKSEALLTCQIGDFLGQTMA